MKFETTPEQEAQIEIWLKTVVYPARLAEQRAHGIDELFITKDDEGNEYPYEGAIGGGLTYEFTDTSLGTAVVVKYSTGETLNITDYESW